MIGRDAFHRVPIFLEARDGVESVPTNSDGRFVGNGNGA